MRLPKLTIPIIVLLFVLGGYFAQSMFFFPTTEVALGAAGDSEVEFKVQGLKCRGTASHFTSLFEGVAGIEKITTFAAKNQAIFRYNSSEISPDRIAMIFQKEHRLEDGTFYQFYHELERIER